MIYIYIYTLSHTHTYICVCVCCALVGLDNKLYKMHGTHIKIKFCFLLLIHHAVADYVEAEVKFHVLTTTLNEDE